MSIESKLCFDISRLFFCVLRYHELIPEPLFILSDERVYNRVSGLKDSCRVLTVGVIHRKFLIHQLVQIVWLQNFVSMLLNHFLEMLVLIHFDSSCILCLVAEFLSNFVEPCDIEVRVLSAPPSINWHGGVSISLSSTHFRPERIICHFLGKSFHLWNVLVC